MRTLFHQAIDIAAPKTPVKNRSYETLEMGAGKSSLRHTLDSHRHCGDCITRRRPPVRIGGSVLGRDRHAGSNAVNSQRDSVDFDRTHCRYGAGCSGRRARASYFTGNLLAFAAAVFVLGLLCARFRMERTAYRYAGVTLAIIVLIPRSHAAWIVALHRFFEVSVGILVALAVVAVWPEHQAESAKQNAE